MTIQCEIECHLFKALPVPYIDIVCDDKKDLFVIVKPMTGSYDSNSKNKLFWNVGQNFHEVFV